MIIGVLASHEGTTLQAVLDACHMGVLKARVGVVISNNSASGTLRRARERDVDAVHLSGKTHPDPAALDQAIEAALLGRGVEVVLLAGYMKKLGPRTLARFRGRILNTHPALLPKFGGHGMYGMAVHRAVLDSKQAESGATVHWVDQDYDTGPIVAQAIVPVLADDQPESLAARVQQAERALLVNVLREIVEGKIELAKRR